MDSGDFSGEPNDAGRIKTRNLIQGMGSIGYDVLGVGERDLADGIPAFLEAVQAARLTSTSASFLYRDTGEPLFAPFAVKSYTAGGRTVKVGYISLDSFNSAFAKEGAGGRVVIMRQPSEGLEATLTALRRRVDLVVLLANLNLRELEETLAAHPGVDLVLATFGGRISPAGALETIAGVPVLYAGDQGKRMGEVRLTLGKSADKHAMTSNHVWLTRRYPSEPKLQKLIDETIARVNEANRNMAQARAAPASAAGGPPSPAPARSRGAADPEPGTSPRQAFLTMTACQSCHGEAWQAYQASAHAHAFETLKKANQDYNPECVSCHVTGFNEPEGFLDARQTPHLINVQCEACHGNAAEHVRDPQRPFGAVPPRRCFGCHTKENSPDFVFFKYWEQIKH
jgi:hypothetical protein